MRTKAISYAGEKAIIIETLVMNETKRLSDIYDKTFLDCDDIVELTGLGRDNVRALMNSKLFPVVKIGNRKIVSILAFVTWQMTQ